MNPVSPFKSLRIGSVMEPDLISSETDRVECSLDLAGILVGRGTTAAFAMGAFYHSRKNCVNASREKRISRRPRSKRVLRPIARARDTPTML